MVRGALGEFVGNALEEFDTLQPVRLRHQNMDSVEVFFQRPGGGDVKIVSLN